ncbi:MAG: hypothetical protein JWR52_308 [Marmoricola sp.]|nr:hypothetical protein [Marmoricola sp.]
MFSSLLRRTALVAVAATAAAGLVSGPALSAGPHTTSLSIRTARPAVAPGGTDTILGSLLVGGGQPLAGKTVTLEAQLAGDPTFLPVGTVISGAHGGVALKVTPAETTRYQWVFAGDAADRGSHSGVATVRVQVPLHAPTRLATSLSIRVATPVVGLTGKDTVSGRLISHRVGLRGKLVLLLARADGTTSWTFGGAKRTGPHGGVAFVVRPKVGSHYELVFEGTRNFRKARSAVVHVAIRPTAISIMTSAVTIAPGGSATVSGVLTDHGAPFAGQSVQLWGRPAGTSQGFAALAAGTTAADGSVSFTVSPTRTMNYFLRFPRTATAPAVQSTTRTIAVS